MQYLGRLLKFNFEHESMVNNSILQIGQYIAHTMGITKPLLLRFLIIHLPLLTLFTFGNQGFSNQDRDLLSLNKLLQASEVDFAKAKIAIDRIIQPKIDGHTIEKNLQEMLASIKAIAGPYPSDQANIAAIRKYLHEKGPWNHYKIFQYDFADPSGVNIGSKVLANYLKTRKGNCVSMPILFLILADRLGLDVGLATAPNHLLVKFTDSASQKTFNIEATSGGYFARDTWYQEKMGVTDKAISKGAYLKKLSRKESLAAMIISAGEYYSRQGQYLKAIEVFKMVLNAYPKSIYSMLKAGNSYAKLLEREFYRVYKNLNQVPREKRERLDLYGKENQRYFAAAEMLGWQEKAVPMSP